MTKHVFNKLRLTKEEIRFLSKLMACNTSITHINKKDVPAKYHLSVSLFYTNADLNKHLRLYAKLYNSIEHQQVISSE